MSVDGMDSVFSIALGLGLRLILSAVSSHNPRVTGTLVGLWEGAVLYHFIDKFPRSPDPYVGLAVRLFVDFLATASFVRLLVVVLWTFLGVVIADITPAFWYDRHLRRFVRRTRRYVRGIEWSSIPLPQLWPLPWLSKMPSRVRFFHIPPRTRSNPNPRPEPVTATAAAAISTPARRRSIPTARAPPLLSETSTSDSTTTRPVRDPLPAASLPSAMRRSSSSKSSSTVSFDIEEPSRNPPMPVLDQPSVPSFRPPTISPISIPMPMPLPMSFDTTSAPLILPTTMPEPAVSLPSVDDLPEIPPTSAPDEPPPPFSKIDPLPHPDGFPHARVRPPRDEKATVRGDRMSVISDGTRDSIIGRADILRQEAMAEEQERDKLKAERLRAIEERRYTEAIKYRVDEQEAHERSLNLHRRAADRYFKAHNLTPEPYTIDIHRLRVREALRQTEIAIRDTLISGGTSLRVIVGRGNHSQNKLPALKLALLAEMQSHHLAAEVDSTNPGVVTINLPSD